VIAEKATGEDGDNHQRDNEEYGTADETDDVSGVSIPGAACHE
jgi:hypothetical protein